MKNIVFDFGIGDFDEDTYIEIGAAVTANINESWSTAEIGFAIPRMGVVDWGNWLFGIVFEKETPEAFGVFSMSVLGFYLTVLWENWDEKKMNRLIEEIKEG